MSIARAYNTATGTWDPILVGATGAAGIVTSATAPSDTTILWMDTTSSSTQLAIPSGGSAGQHLVKSSNTDYATSWVDVPQSAGKNLIINGAFEIWQRGTSFTNTLYTADRWWSANNSGTLQQSTDVPAGFTYSLYNTTASSYSVGQAIELPATGAPIVAPGTPVTLSFWAKAPSATTMSPLLYYRNSKFDGTNQSAFTNSGNAISIGTSWARYSWTYYASTPNSSNTLLGFELNNLPAGAKVTGIQVEVGSAATPFTRAGGTLQGELAACQRYYYRSTGPGLYSPHPTSGYVFSSTQANITFIYPVTMRTAPTSVEFSAVCINDSVNASWAISAITLDNPGTSSTSLQCTISGATAGRFGRIINNVTVGGLLAVSAEY
jgi:Carbohydrate binding domain